MATLFTDRYLRYSGRKPLGAYQREVLVPMNAWRVLVPERSSEALNIFEEAIIGLVASRCSDIRKIAGLLCLAEALVEYIVQQMKMNGWLTERMGVTPKGKRILEKQVQLRTRLTTGYVFQDMFTGELMPRFVHDLKYIEATEYQHGKPCFKLDIAKEKSYTPTIVRLPKSEQLLQPPSPFQVVDAIRDHNVAIYNSKLQSDEFLDLERIQHDSIELVDSSPVRVYLWCWLYRQDKAGRHWLELLIRNRCPKYLLGWRDICRSTDERTVIASVISTSAVGDTFLLMFPKQESHKKVACLLADQNSIVHDFVARQKIGGTHLKYHVKKQIVNLPPEKYSESDIDFIVPKILELTCTAYDMQPFAESLSYNGEPFKFAPERRHQLKSELDAYYAKLYGLTRDELRYILDPADVMGEDYPSETFRVLKNKELKEFGEFRTQRLVLEAWDKLKRGELA